MFGITSNFGKGGTPGYCLYTPLEQCLTTVYALDESLEAMLRLEMPSDVEIYSFSVMGILFLCEAHVRFSNFQFLVDGIFANDA